MPGQDYVPPHAAALKELARRVEADDGLSAEVRAAFIEDIASAEPASLRSLMKAVWLDETPDPS